MLITLVFQQGKFVTMAEGDQREEMQIVYRNLPGLEVVVAKVKTVEELGS